MKGELAALRELELTVRDAFTVVRASVVLRPDTAGRRLAAVAAALNQLERLRDEAPAPRA